MARGCSDSDSEEERHDRFKSERNLNSAPLMRTSISTSLSSYSSRARSPLRHSSHRVSRHRSKYSEERRPSPPRRVKSPEKRNSWDRKPSPKESWECKSVISEHKHSKHRHKKTHEKFRIEKYEEESKKYNVDTNEKSYVRKRKSEELDDLVSNDPESQTDEKKHKKHKRSHDRSDNSDKKKQKKEKKHKKKHKRKDECESELKPDCMPTTNNESEPVIIKIAEDTTQSGAECTEDSDNDVSEGSSSPKEISCTNGNQEENKPESDHEEGELSASESEQYFGPALPPGKKTEMPLGPQMPPDSDSYGPALPPTHSAPSKPMEETEEEDNAGDLIGPLPAGHESAVQSALDARASILKYQMDNKVSYEKEPVKKVAADLFLYTPGVSIGAVIQLLWWPLLTIPNLPASLSFFPPSRLSPHSRLANQALIVAVTC